MPELKPRNEPYPEPVSNLLKHFPHRDGYLLQLFRVFANSERFLRKGALNLLDKESPLSLQEREIVILRTCAKNACEYEWGVHVTAFAEHAGLSDEQVRNTLVPTPGDCWGERERLLIEVVDELCESSRLSAERLDRFQKTWSLEQQLEIFALCGNYHTISYVANVARLPRESFAATF